MLLILWLLEFSVGAGSFQGPQRHARILNTESTRTDIHLQSLTRRILDAISAEKL